MSFLLSATPILLLGVGIFYVLRLRGFYLLHPIRCMRLLFAHRPSDGISPFRALTVALAGTLGVGNIVGVASALYFGGAGAVLWMLVSSLLAMVLKYAEITLAVRHRTLSPEGQLTGGASYYIRAGLTRVGLPRLGGFLAAVFAAMCLLNAVTMGSLLQINAVAGAMEEGFSVPPLVTGVAVAILAVAAVKGGARRISALTEKLVPFMTLGFLVVCLAVLILRRERIPAALASVWREALEPVAAGAGIGGFLLSRGARFGVMRGLVSNEAGCGTAPIAHASADTDLPARQGLYGLVEVFVDTVLLCTVTALCILVSDSGPAAFGEDTVRTAQAAFSSVLGDWAGWFFALAILLFGVATVVCWGHYGMSCVDYLTTGRAEGRTESLTRGRACGQTRGQACSRAVSGGARWVYVAVLALSLVAGAVTAPTLAWRLADGAIALMTLLNLGVLLLMSGEVKAETALLFPRHKSAPPCISCERNSTRKEKSP